MKILHFSDTHLWITLENTLREEDFYCNFKYIIDQILEKKPEVVIHSGDLFHTSKPSNKAISVVVENFLKLEKSGITVIIIAGNHDTPRLSLTTHPFEIFKSLHNFYVFYEPKIDFLDIDKTRFIVLPHIHDENIFASELKKWSEFFIEWKNNIFISHFWISAREYDEYTDEISGINISMENLKQLKKCDYVALGHYHKNFSIWNMNYPGSIEHTSFNQKNYKIWYNIFDTVTQKKEVFEIDSRPMIDIGIIDAKNFEKTTDILEYLELNLDKKTLKNAIVKLILENMTHKLILEFNEKVFLHFFAECFYFEYKKIKYIDVKENMSTIIETQNTIQDNFETFFDRYDFWSRVIEKEVLKKELKDIININV